MSFTDSRPRPQGPLGRTRRIAGFTLIELMIAVAIIGILASIAYPSYQGYVERSLRADAYAGLSIAASELERCYTENYTYAKTACSVTSPSPDGNYSISYEPDENKGYVIRASTSENDGCDQSLTLDGQGNQDPPGCW